jgi:hypothetical protein
MFRSLLIATCYGCRTQEGVSRKLKGFEMIDKGIPRHDYELTDKDGIVLAVYLGEPCRRY